MKQNIKKNIGKKEITQTIVSDIGTPSRNIQMIVEDLIDVLINILKKNNKLNIKNFGSFYLILKKEREGRNPKTNETHTISSRMSVSFRVSSLLKKEINEIK